MPPISISSTLLAASSALPNLHHRRRQARCNRAAKRHVVERAHAFDIAGELQIIRHRIALHVAIHDDGLGQRVGRVDLAAPRDIAAKVHHQSVRCVEGAVVRTVAQMGQRPHNCLIRIVQVDRVLIGVQLAIEVDAGDV